MYFIGHWGLLAGLIAVQFTAGRAKKSSKPKVAKAE